jgi:hypothetical protein
VLVGAALSDASAARAAAAAAAAELMRLPPPPPPAPLPDRPHTLGGAEGLRALAQAMRRDEPLRRVARALALDRLAARDLGGARLVLLALAEAAGDDKPVAAARVSPDLQRRRQQEDEEEEGAPFAFSLAAALAEAVRAGHALTTGAAAAGQQDEDAVTPSRVALDDGPAGGSLWDVAVDRVLLPLAGAHPLAHEQLLRLVGTAAAKGAIAPNRAAATLEQALARAQAAGFFAASSSSLAGQYRRAAEAAGLLIEGVELPARLAEVLGGAGGGGGAE